jgi:uncharacterized protein (TIGR03067 family)
MRRVLPLVAVLSLAFAPAPFPKPDPTQKDLKELQGEWRVVSSVMDGGKAKADEIKAMKAVIKGNRYTVYRGAEVAIEHTFSIDSTKKPKTIDFTVSSRMTQGCKRFAIYEVNSDNLKICISTGVWRPNEFSGQGISRQGSSRKGSGRAAQRPHDRQGDTHLAVL